MNNGSSHHAVDASPTRRPGVPEQRSPKVVGAAHWTTPQRQPIPEGVIKDAQREFTATFGTGQPPRGLSGALRRLAYRAPDYEVRRWALLLLADRVEWAETRLAEVPALGWAAAAIAAAAAAGTFALRRR